MNADLEKLVELEALDLQVQQIRRSLQEFPAKIAELEARVKKSIDAVAAAQARVKEAQAQKKAFLEKIEQAEISLGKSQERLNSITTNREYDAVHAEIESNKNILASANTNKARLDDDITALVKAEQDAQAELEKTKAECDPAVADLKGQMATFDSQIAEVTNKRTELLKTLNRQYARSYEAIMKRRKQGGALSRVSSDSKICSACHKVLESQLVTEIRKSNRLLLCQSCGSIFVWVDGPAAQA